MGRFPLAHYEMPTAIILPAFLVLLFARPFLAKGRCRCAWRLHRADQEILCGRLARMSPTQDCIFNPRSSQCLNGEFVFRPLGQARRSLQGRAPSFPQGVLVITKKISLMFASTKRHPNLPAEAELRRWRRTVTRISATASPQVPLHARIGSGIAGSRSRFPKLDRSNPLSIITLSR
jgi:hypothetical protein